MAGAGMTRYHLTHAGPEQTPQPGRQRHRFRGQRRGHRSSSSSPSSPRAPGWWWWSSRSSSSSCPAPTAATRRSRRCWPRTAPRPPATEAPTLRHHVVLVLVDRLDLATARALQLARSSGPSGGEVRAVHFIIDARPGRASGRGVEQLGLGKRAAGGRSSAPTGGCAGPPPSWRPTWPATARPRSLLVLPRRAYRGLASRLLHDHTADRIVAAVSTLPRERHHRPLRRHRPG